jgi:hypothetical protein
MVPYTESQALNYYNRRAAMASTFIKVAGGPHGQGIVFGSAARKKQMVDFMRYAHAVAVALNLTSPLDPRVRPPG